MRKDNLIVVPHLTAIGGKDFEILRSVVEKRKVYLQGEYINVNPTIIMLLDPKFLKVEKTKSKGYFDIKNNFPG